LAVPCMLHRESRLWVGEQSLPSVGLGWSTFDADVVYPFSYAGLEVSSEHVIATPLERGGSNRLRGARGDCPAWGGIVSLLALTGLTEPPSSNRTITMPSAGSDREYCA
jgi:hypothetical protein